MMRLLLPIGLTLAGLLASGCSGGYYVDATQYRQSRVAPADDPPRARMSSRASRTRTARATTTQSDATIGAAKLGATTDARPLPKRGTPEWDQAQAREKEQEKRVNDAINSICRGC